MSDTPPPSVLGSLPSSRPERRSAKRPARTDPTEAVQPPAAAKPKPAAKPRPSSAPKLKAVSQPGPGSGTGAEPPPPPESQRTVRPTPSIDLTEVAGLVVKAAAELAEIGLSASARALKLAVSRLPRP